MDSTIKSTSFHSSLNYLLLNLPNGEIVAVEAVYLKKVALLPFPIQNGNPQS